MDMPKNKFANFGNKLLEIRNRLGLNQTDFGEKVGVSQKAISHYELGLREPDFEVLLKISHFAKVSLYDLTGLEIMKNVEKDMENPKVSERAIKIAEFYDSLPENDPIRRMLEAYALDQDTESEKAE